MARSVLDKASALAARGKDAAVIALLEPQLPLFRDSARYYRILGGACLRTGDLGGANTYLRRSEQLNPDDEATLLALGALSLRRGETDKAAAFYLSVLEKNPSSSLGKASLSFLRKPEPQARIAELVENGQIKRFFPHEPGLPFSPLLLVVPIACAVVLGLMAYFGKSLVGGGSTERPEILAINLSQQEKDNPLGSGGTSRFILTEKEALEAFEKARSLFQGYRDNAALIEINRLLNSNASGAIKEKARALRGFVSAPDWSSLKDSPSYAQVAAEPSLHEGCAVIWKGRAANYREDASGRTFDFLVGYHDRNRLEGIVATRLLDPGLSIPMDSPFEALCVIVSEPKGFSLNAMALHELKDSP